MEKVKYLYITSAPYDRGVYQTQVLDWLNLYNQKGLNFSLVQLFDINSNTIKKSVASKEKIRNAFEGEVQFVWRYPAGLKKSKINNLILATQVKKYLSKYQTIVVFSRSVIGYEVEFLKSRFPGRVIYYYDLRGAWPEEFLDTIKFNKNYSEGSFNVLNRIYQVCYKCQQQADKIFAVSSSLMDYYNRVFDTNRSKFVLYPCLSSSKKFYYSEDQRNSTRAELGINEDETVFIYTGGLDYSYSFVKEFLKLVDTMSHSERNVRLLVIAKKITDNFISMVDTYPAVKKRLLCKESVPNEQMVHYLNAADFALLLRNNVPLNNVSSPVKFAEYQLCGLPVCISEAVTDYADYCQKYKSGVVISNEDFDNLDFCKYEKALSTVSERTQIAEVAKKYLSKEEYVDKIIEELRIR